MNKACGQAGGSLVMVVASLTLLGSLVAGLGQFLALSVRQERLLGASAQGVHNAVTVGRQLQADLEQAPGSGVTIDYLGRGSADSLQVVWDSLDGATRYTARYYVDGRQQAVRDLSVTLLVPGSSTSARRVLAQGLDPAAPGAGLWFDASGSQVWLDLGTVRRGNSSRYRVNSFLRR